MRQKAYGLRRPAQERRKFLPVNHGQGVHLGKQHPKILLDLLFHVSTVVHKNLDTD